MSSPTVAPRLRAPGAPLPLWLRLLATGLFAASTAAAAADLRIAWFEDRPGGTILTPTILIAAHDGEVDFFDLYRPASPLLEGVLQELAIRRLTPLPFRLNTQYPDARFRAFVAEPIPATFAAPPPLWPDRRHTYLIVDPQRHRYLSFLLTVQPADDAFVGNDDPQRYRLFDDDGHFLGPFHIDVYGSDALDAGVCANSEAQLIWLDRGPDAGTRPCSDGEGEGEIRPHPGLNGSQRNPGGVPVRVLGGTSAFSDEIVLEFDRVAADFSRPGRRLGRLVVSSDTSWFGASGAWYSPDRAGEGFSLQVLPAAAPGGRSRALVYWYTYAPDGSGRQVWLTGIGEIDSVWTPVITIPLHRTQGGGFASTGNPEDVVASPWGELTVSFTDCDRATVAYRATEPGYGTGSFTVDRLGPPVEGLDWLCDPTDPWLPQSRP
jgi:hypothetical protein